MTEVSIQTVAFGSDSLKLKIGKKNLSCFILANGQRIIASESIPKALSYDGKSSNWLFEFLMTVNRITPIEPALLEALGRPLTFKNTNSDSIKHGVAAEVFVEACEAIVKAKNDGFLYLSELRFAKAAEDFLNNLAQKNISTEIDMASGFSLFKENHKMSLARKMAKATLSNYPIWLNTFTDDFFETILKFKAWAWTDLNTNAEKIAEYLNEIIFSRIDGALLETLEITTPRKKYRKNGSPQQSVPNAKLEEYLTALSALMTTSAFNEAIFVQLLNKSFPKKRELIVEKPLQNKMAAEKNSAFEETLAKALKKT